MAESVPDLPDDNETMPVSVNIRLPLSLWTELRQEAEQLGVSFSALTRAAVHHGLTPAVRSIADAIDEAQRGPQIP